MTATEVAKYREILSTIQQIIDKANQLEVDYAEDLSRVHPVYFKSAANLLHYLAFRSFDIDQLQADLRDLGLSSLTNVEGHVMRSLFGLQRILLNLQGEDAPPRPKGYVSVKKSAKIMRKNSRLLFGYKSNKRRTRIMVTLPTTAADDPAFVRRLVRAGMNCARINCAHDDAETWERMIANVRAASASLQRKVKIAMDLGGPKLRTGPMIEGPKVTHIKPRRNDLGQVVQPAQIWIAPPDILPPPNAEVDAILPVSESLFRRMKRGNTIYFTDARDKKIKIKIDRKQGKGKWGVCSDSAYVETGTELVLQKVKASGEERQRVGELLPKEQFISLFTGDTLMIHKDPRPGENAVYDDDGVLLQAAHVSCTLPEIFNDVKAGEPIFFDDGKIEGRIEVVSSEELTVKILHAKTNGSKLKADKGINLPDSQLSVSGLTEKDKVDLDFVAQHADAVNFSFVNRPEDVEALQELLDEKESDAGIILKIETQEAFSKLPAILLAAMRNFPVGVMIARGDLAIETGWKNFATIQQEIMRLCGAAHIPDVWATQVLESLAKKGTPSRAEITDAALAQQAECVMLNKGAYIDKAVKMLDKILRRMQRFQQKTAVILPKLDDADQLRISHQAFDV